MYYVEQHSLAIIECGYNYELLVVSNAYFGSEVLAGLAFTKPPAVFLV